MLHTKLTHEQMKERYSYIFLIHSEGKMLNELHGKSSGRIRGYPNKLVKGILDAPLVDSGINVSRALYPRAGEESVNTYPKPDSKARQGLWADFRLFLYYSRSFLGVIRSLVDNSRKSL